MLRGFLTSNLFIVVLVCGTSTFGAEGGFLDLDVDETDTVHVEDDPDAVRAKKLREMEAAKKAAAEAQKKAAEEAKRKAAEQAERNAESSEATDATTVAGTDENDKVEQAQPSDAVVETAEAYVDPGPAPALKPKLLYLTYIGGKGRQTTKHVGIEGNMAVASGQGWRLTVDLESLKGEITGDVETPTDEKVRYRPPLYKKWNKPEQMAAGQKIYDPKLKITYNWQTLQTHTNLQQPYISCEDKGWKMWGWSMTECTKAALGVDTRLYGVWLAEPGTIGALIETHSGVTTAKRDPRDLSKRANISGSPSKHTSMAICLIRGEDGTIIKGQWYPNSRCFRWFADPWGRFYMADIPGNSNPGIVIMDDQIRIEDSIEIASAGEKTYISKFVRFDNLLLFGGFTKSKKLKTKKATQRKLGESGKDIEGDAFFGIIQLWRKSE